LKNNKKQSIINKCKQLWSEISDYGLEENASYIEKIRVSVLNRGIIIALLLLSGVSLSHLYPFDIKSLLSRFTVMSFLLFLLQLNKRKCHKTSRLALNIVMPLLIFTIGVLYGAQTAIQYNFLIFILTSFFFHKELRTRLSFAFFNFVLFLLLKYCWATYGSVLSLELGSFLEVTTFIITASVIMSIMYLFLEQIEKYNVANTKLLETLESNNHRLKVANEELERFAYIASHDLKTPLRTIISFTGLLERDFKRNKLNSFPDYFTYVKNGARQMDNLISSTLEYSKVNHEVIIERKKIDLNIIVNNIKMNLLQNYGNEVSIEKGDLPIVLGEEGQMILLFQNLIENGLKYNENDDKTVKITSESTPEKIFITIKDNGIGIHEKYHEQIFSMFKRLHTSDIYEGTGLGLAICKKIVDRINGKIWLESEEGKGATFFIELTQD
jgi:signal transduction histidine kinase